VGIGVAPSEGEKKGALHFATAPFFSPLLRSPDARPSRKQGFLWIKPVTEPELRLKTQKM